MPREAVDPLRELESASFSELAVSAYIPAGTTMAFDAFYHETALNSAAHQARPSLEPAARAVLERERPVIQQWLELVRPPANVPLAVFACKPAGLLDGWRLIDSVSEVRVGPQLWLQPMRSQLEKYPPALVVVADKESGVLFRAILGSVEEVTEREGRTVKHHKQGGWSADKYQRRQDMYARVNLEAVARLALAQRADFYPRVYLAGPPEARAELKHLLARRLGSRLAGELSVSLFEPHSEMAEKLREELYQVRSPSS